MKTGLKYKLGSDTVVLNY